MRNICGVCTSLSLHCLNVNFCFFFLNRGLNFICTFVQLLSKHDETEENIQPCLQEAYDNALKVHHGFLARTSIPVGSLGVIFSNMIQSLTI